MLLWNHCFYIRHCISKRLILKCRCSILENYTLSMTSMDWLFWLPVRGQMEHLLKKQGHIDSGYVEFYSREEEEWKDHGKGCWELRSIMDTPRFQRQIGFTIWTILKCFTLKSVFHSEFTCLIQKLRTLFNTFAKGHLKIVSQLLRWPNKKWNPEIFKPFLRLLYFF